MSKVATEILAGRHDADIRAISEALVARIQGDEIDAYWVVYVGDDKFTRSDLTFKDLRRFEKLTGQNSMLVNMLEASAEHLAIMCSCWLASQGTPIDEAQKLVDDMAAGDIRTDIEYEVAETPKDD